MWISAVAAAVFSVVYALAFRSIETAARSYIAGSNGYWGFLIAPVLFVAAWWVVRRYAPEAAGSGIPQVMTANETVYDGPGKATVDRLLSVKTMLVKILSS